MSDDLFSPIITDADPDAFEAIRASIPRALRIRHFLALDLAEHITQILRERRKSRRWLAQRLGKTDSELSKWLSGTHNLTLDSIAKLSDALEVDLVVSTRFPMGYFGSQAIDNRARAVATPFDQMETTRTRSADLRTVRPLSPTPRNAPVIAKSKRGGLATSRMAATIQPPYTYSMAA